MKLLKFYLLIFLLPAYAAQGQNWPACDSLEIDCCIFDSLGQNTVTLFATNQSSELFPYPSFALLDTNMDTIAMESVTYFGIGWSPQPHTLNLVAPLTLPFNGYLYLFSWMQDTLPCIFPFTIPDTTTGISIVPDKENLLDIFPNPVQQGNFVTINTGNLQPGNAKLTLWNMQGRMICNKDYQISPKKINKIEIDNILTGIYVIRLEQSGNFYTGRFVRL